MRLDFLLHIPSFLTHHHQSQLQLQRGVLPINSIHEQIKPNHGIRILTVLGIGSFDWSSKQSRFSRSCGLYLYLDLVIVNVHIGIRHVEVFRRGTVVITAA